MIRDLYRLIYLSHNEITGSTEMIHKEIEHILMISRERNVAADITGALMFNKNGFAQVLEGPHNQIQETFERIQCDLRHSNVVILDFEPIQTRRFNQWSMAYIGREIPANDVFTKIRRESGFDSNRLTGERIYDLLQMHLYAAEKIAPTMSIRDQSELTFK